MSWLIFFSSSLFSHIDDCLVFFYVRNVLNGLLVNPLHPKSGVVVWCEFSSLLIPQRREFIPIGYAAMCVPASGAARAQSYPPPEPLPFVQPITSLARLSALRNCLLKLRYLLATRGCNGLRMFRLSFNDRKIRKYIGKSRSEQTFISLYLTLT